MFSDGPLEYNLRQAFMASRFPNIENENEVPVIIILLNWNRNYKEYISLPFRQKEKQIKLFIKEPLPTNKICSVVFKDNPILVCTGLWRHPIGARGVVCTGNITQASAGETLPATTTRTLPRRASWFICWQWLVRARCIPRLASICLLRERKLRLLLWMLCGSIPRHAPSCPAKNTAPSSPLSCNERNG
jgi:hypothetical protein